MGLARGGEPRVTAPPAEARAARARRRPVSGATFVVWLLVCLSGWGLACVADVFQSHAPAFPLAATVAASAALSVLSSVMALGTGRLAWRGFALYQPFAGGRAFVALQAVGFAALAGSSVGSFVYVSQVDGSGRAAHRYGVLSVLGGLAAAASALLFGSVLVFVPSQVGRAGAVAARGGAWWRDVSSPPNREIGLVALFVTIEMAVCCVAEYWPHLASACTLVALGFHALCGFTIHVVIGCWNTPRYRAFMPNAGSLRRSLHQAVGWGLFLATVYAATALYQFGAASKPSWHVAYGLMSAASSVTLILFTRVQRLPEATGDVDARSPLGEDGPLTMTVGCVGNTAVVWGIALLLSDGRYVRNLSFVSGLRVVQLLSSLFLFTLPPCTHLLGRVAYGRRFALWTPFRGSTDFLILQAVGWCCFGFAVVFAALQLTEEAHSRFILTQATLLALSQALIHASLYHFGVMHGRGVAAGTGGPTAAAADGGGSGRRRMAAVLNGEMLTALLLGVVGLLLCVVADVAATGRLDGLRGVGMRTGVIVDVSTALTLVAVPLSQLSMRDRTPLLNPFAGSGGYIAVQVFGWSVYAIDVIVVAVELATGETWRSPAVPMQHTLRSLIHTLPLVCITIGSFFETRAQEYELWQQEEASEAAAELLGMLRLCLGDAERYARAEQLVGSLAGRSAGAGARRGEEASAVRREAAALIVSIMCVAGAVAFLVATFWAAKQAVLSLVLGVAGATVNTVSCLSVHYAYGLQVHGATGAYRFFMPFRGGHAFVSLQAIGWSLCAASGLLVVVSCAERGGSPLGFICAAVFGVMGQLCVFNSVSRFDASPRPPSFVEDNAEGIAAVVTLLGSFAFSRVYDLYVHGDISSRAGPLLPIMVTAICTSFAIPTGLASMRRRARGFDLSEFAFFGGSDSLDDDGEVAAREDSWRVCGERSPSGQSGQSGHSGQSTVVLASDPASPVGTGVAECVGSPLSQLMSAGFSVVGDDAVAVPWAAGGAGAAADAGEDAARRLRRAPSRLVGVAALTFVVAGALAVIVSTLFPVAVLYVLYAYVYCSAPGLSAALASWRTLMGTFVALIAVTALLERTAVSVPRFVSGARNAACTYAVYSIPAYVVVGSLSLPFVLPAAGAWVFATSMVLLSCFSTVKLVRWVSYVMSVVGLGVLLYQHLVTRMLLRRERLRVVEAACDVLLPGFWIWYDRRYGGAPHQSGRLRSVRATAFMERFFFRFMARYFGLCVVVDKDLLDEAAVYGLDTARGLDRARAGEVGAASVPHVDLSRGENQYLFSFHPHGVFPGTALFLPLTNEWKRRVGCSGGDSPFVSTHCADVLFSVPFMRDFVMALGARSVSHRGVESSLGEGNSVLIVTGGQAEMLLTRMSETEMHLVTHHTGFLRLAMKRGVPLVPLLCFAEHNVMGNIRALRIQRWCLRLLGFPFPTLPYGRWYLPLPTRRRLMVVVGRPIMPLPGRSSAENADHVQELRERYFKHIVHLFYKYRAVAGYPAMELFLHDGVDAEPVKASPPPETVPLVPLTEAERERRREDLAGTRRRRRRGEVAG